MVGAAERIVASASSLMELTDNELECSGLVVDCIQITGSRIEMILNVSAG
jgi:hypothetical protein